MTETKRMSQVDLKALVAREISLAESDRASASKKHIKALQYYQGEMPDIVAEVGRSSVVSRDLADVVGWILPGIMRVFTASEHMAIAEPVGAEDDAWAMQATNGMNYVFWKENDGYRIVYNATWDSLITGNGVVKVWWDDTPKHEVSFHSGLTDDAFAMLVNEDAVEVLEHTPGTTTIDGIEVPVHDVKIKRLVSKGRIMAEAIAPEDFGIVDDAKTTAEARFKYHKSRKSRSDLVEMKFDRKLVASLGKAADNDTAERAARDQDHTDDSGDPSTDLIDLYECFIRVDIDGDGIAELCRVYYAGSTGGGEMLDWEEWEDEDPFDDIPCNPMPHRWQAQSVSDETMDVQQVKTVLLRQALDNTYATNNPQRFVAGKLSNPEELFSPSFGGAVFGDVNTRIEQLTVPFVANHAYDAINYQDQVIERRTGVSRTTMALDPEALQNQTATANQNAKDAAYSQIELIARNQAELGWKKVFRKIMRLLIKHQDTEKTIRMQGEAVQIDPHSWNADMDVSINVGLGTGSRDRDLAMLQQVLGNQAMLAERAAMLSPAKALDMLPYIMTTLMKQAEAAGIRSPELFYPKITPDEIEQGKKQIEAASGQPDPKVQLEMAKIEANRENEKAKAEAAAIKEREQLAADLQTQEADRQNQLIIEAQKQDFEREKLAEEARQRDLDRQQQWQLEMLKMNAQATQVEADRTERVTQADKASAQSREIEMAKMGATEKDGKIVGKDDRMADVMERLIAAQSAPKRLVRGPDGKAIGVETVTNG